MYQGECRLKSLKFLYIICSFFIGLNAIPTPSSALPSISSKADLNQTLAHPSPSDLQYNYGYRHQYFEDDFNRDLTFQLGLGLKAQKEIQKTFRAVGELILRFERGNVQGLQREDNRRDNGIYLSQAFLEWEPWDRVRLRFGALDQSTLESPLLISGQTFLGQSQSLGWNWLNSDFAIQAQQVVPTSARLSTRAIEKEPLPWFYTLGLSGQIKVSKAIEISGHATYYRFHLLPSQIANQSYLFGNTIDKLSINHAEFRYGFAGYTTRAEISLKPLAHWGLTFTTDYIENQLAPSDRGQGVVYALAPNYTLSSGTRLSLSLLSFLIHSDTSPAYYNSWQMGHNNRKGHGLEMEIQLKSGLKFGGRYIQSQVLKETPVQKDQTYFLFMMETDYESI